MTQGVSPIDALREQNHTELKLKTFQRREDFILPNQGPSVLPLSGKAGSPLKLAAAKQRPLSKRHSVSDVPKSFEEYRPTHFKETLPVPANEKGREGHL